MGVDKTHITNLLEMRFDYQSARNVLVNWRKSINRKDDIDAFNDEDLKSLLKYLKDTAPDAVRVNDAIERLILSADAAHADTSDHVEMPAPAEYVSDAAPETVEDAVDAPAAQPDEVPAEDNTDIHCGEHNEEHCGEHNEEHCGEHNEEQTQDNGESHADNNNGGKKKKKKH